MRVRAGSLAGDFRSTWRALLRRPGFTCVAVLMLGLGLGVVSTTFTLVNAVALKPLMITDPEDLVGIFAESTEPPRSYRSFSYPEYAAIRDGTESLSEVAAHAVVSAGIGEGDFARRVEVHTISADYFRTLGVQLPLGRAFSLAEEQGVEAPTVVVSHDYWERNGSRPDLLGSTIRVNGEEVVVVGIAPDGFTERYTCQF